MNYIIIIKYNFIINFQNQKGILIYNLSKNTLASPLFFIQYKHAATLLIADAVSALVTVTVPPDGAKNISCDMVYSLN